MALQQSPVGWNCCLSKYTDLSDCECFSLQFDESVDMMYTAQLIVGVCMVFKDSTTKEDFLTLLAIKERTRGKDVHNKFKRYVTGKISGFLQIGNITFWTW